MAATPNDLVTIYVTKDAPMKGIRKMEARINADGWADPRGDWHVFRPTEFALSVANATIDAERRRARMLASLEAKIAGIRAIDLTKPVEG